jgi:hypothetical protein
MSDIPMQTNHPTSTAIAEERVEVGRTGMSPRFLSQKMEQKEPLKKMPSTAAKAMRRSAKPA